MSKQTVLVIEDNDINMKLVKTLLGLADYDVIASMDAETGISLARENVPDLILMDIQLPGMDGLKATQIIKQDDRLRSIPVIALTSYAMQGDEERAREAGCSGYISKPIDTRNFAKTLKGFLNKPQASDLQPATAPCQYQARILIVDDEPMNVKLLVAQLEGNSYEIIQAFGGREALEKAFAQHPDLILLDVMMPDMDGYAVTHKLKNDPQTSAIPIILITALSGTHDKIQGLEMGAEEFLNKPVSNTELIARVKSMLRLRQYQEQLSIRSESGAVFSEGCARSFISEANQAIPKVLLVEDDQKDVKLIQNYLADQPYEVITAYDGEEALALALKENIDLILLDILLPGTDGFEICNRLKQMDETKNTQIVLITSLSDIESRIKGVEMGADDFLVKPINNRELLVRINALLKKKVYMDQLQAQYETAMDSAIKDGMTGLYNHAYFKRFLEIEVKRAIRQTYSAALLMMDLDDFKAHNDRLGHLAGDIILRESAKIIQAATREIDLAVRYGGEEFAIVLPYAGKNNALSVAERIRSSIESHTYTLAGVQPPQRMTISIGIATCPEDALSVEALIQKSDAMLYRAKENGKNQICVQESKIAASQPGNMPVAPPELIKADCASRPI